jgi:hypothetical protein
MKLSTFRTAVTLVRLPFNRILLRRVRNFHYERPWTATIEFNHKPHEAPRVRMAGLLKHSYGIDITAISKGVPKVEFREVGQIGIGLERAWKVTVFILEVQSMLTFSSNSNVDHTSITVPQLMQAVTHDMGVRSVSQELLSFATRYSSKRLFELAEIHP